METTPDRTLTHRRAARYAWALLLARIDEVFPLRCPQCGGAMRSIAFVTIAPAVRDLLAHLGEPTAPPRNSPENPYRITRCPPTPGG